jgi:hypothetical protein
MTERKAVMLVATRRRASCGLEILEILEVVEIMAAPRSWLLLEIMAAPGSWLRETIVVGLSI